MDTKALRQKVLDLAIRGKLVPQDPNDEPASVLLERIRAEKQQMVKDGKLKAKDLNGHSVIFKGEDNLHYEKMPDGTEKCIENEIPFEVPEGWAWTRLGAVCKMSNGTSKRTGSGGCDIDVLRLADLDENNIHAENCRQINLSCADIDKYRLNENDLLFIRVNGSKQNVGKSYCFTGTKRQLAYCDHLIRGVVDSTLNAALACMFTRSPSVRLLIENRIVSAAGQNTVSQPSLSTLILPIPPTQEQQRIVNATSLAFAQIDLLEKEKTDLQSIITQAKSKILDLAIRGKLVPQDPNDEPASVLLERIRAEKESLIRQGKIKREKNESFIFRGDDKSYYLSQKGNLLSLDELVPFNVPWHWQWCRLGEVCNYGNCYNADTSMLPKDVWILDLEDIEKNTGKLLQRVTLAKRKSNSAKHTFVKGQVLYSKLRPYLNKVLIAEDDGCCTSEILPLEFNSIVFPPYARYILMSAYFLSYANQCSYGVKMPRLGTNDGRQAWIPIPPTNEQHRIVTAIESAFAQLDSILIALA